MTSDDPNDLCWPQMTSVDPQLTFVDPQLNGFNSEIYNF